MGSFVPYLSSILKAGQSFCGPRHGCTFYYMLFLTLFLFSLPTATVAFSSSYSDATQCGPFSATWNWSGNGDNPPFVLLILPVGAKPTICEVPQSAFNLTTRTGKYTLDKLPLKSGTQYIVSMLYGNDRNGGNVSVIKTVGDSPDSSCLPTKPPSPDSFIKLDPPNPSQCSGQTVSWNSSVYSEPPNIQAFIPGGSAFHFKRPDEKSAVRLAWEVNIRATTQMVLLVQPVSLIADINAITSQLITVTGSQGDKCLQPGSPSSTGAFTPPTAAPGEDTSPTTGSGLSTPSTTGSTAATSPAEATTQPKNNKNIIAISVVGGLSFIAIVCGAIALYRSFKRKTNTYHISNYGSDGPSHEAGGVFITRTRTSWGWASPTRKDVGNRISTAFNFAASPGGDEKKGGLGTKVVLPFTTSHAIPVYKPPFGTWGQTESPKPPQQPHRNFSLPLESPSASSTDISLSEKRLDPSIAYGVPTTDEKHSGLGEVRTQSPSDASFNGHEHDRELEQHVRNPRLYTQPLETV